MIITYHGIQPEQIEEFKDLKHNENVNKLVGFPRGVKGFGALL